MGALHFILQKARSIFGLAKEYFILDVINRYIVKIMYMVSQNN